MGLEGALLTRPADDADLAYALAELLPESMVDVSGAQPH